MSDLTTWMESHRYDYLSALTRVEKTRTLLLSASAETGGEVLKKSYVNAVLSIKTPLERHERAFTGWAAGSMTIGEATDEVVYPNQKQDWIERTFRNTNWSALALATRRHVENERYDQLLETLVDKLVGVSHRKGAFVLAMAGLHEFMCVDSNVANYAGLEESEDGETITYRDADEYFEACDDIIDGLPNPDNLPPFLVQWAIYDHQRGEHARHMAFYREVLPEVLWRD